MILGLVLLVLGCGCAVTSDVLLVRSRPGQRLDLFRNAPTGRLPHPRRTLDNFGRMLVVAASLAMGREIGLWAPLVFVPYLLCMVLPIGAHNYRVRSAARTNAVA